MVAANFEVATKKNKNKKKKNVQWTLYPFCTLYFFFFNLFIGILRDTIRLLRP